MARKATRGSDAQFTYDFGIAIAQSTVSKVARLTGVTLSLASAFYALKTTASEYVDTLRENTLRFGGALSTMKQMEQAQDRLIKGISLFSVDDQLRGMNSLMAAGVDVGKNMQWISKAAHATGKSMAQFSGAVANAIAGNMGQLVEMGVLTQRATRSFDKFAANTVMRQQAIMNFLKTHKGLQAAIKNDFETIQDQMLRIKEIWRAFLQSIIGRPNDPASFYGQIRSSMKLVANALAKNLQQIKRIGYVIGSVLGWVIKQVGYFVVWLGKQVKNTLNLTEKSTEGYVEFTRSLLVWLEFWKLKVVDFFKEYGGAIKTVLKLLIAYKALKMAFVIPSVAIESAWALYKAIKATYKLQMAYIAFQGPAISKTARVLQSLAVWMPRPFRKAWVASGRYLGLIWAGMVPWANKVKGLMVGVGKALVAPFWAMLHPIKALKGLFGVLLKGAYAFMLPFYKMRLFIMGLPKLLSRVLPIAGKTLLGWGKNIINFLLNLPKIFMASLKTIMLGVRYIRVFFTAIRTGMMALNATNPVGWIILGITLLAIAYKKFALVRQVVNGAIKMWLEWVKLLWNIVYGGFIGLAVLIKRTWQWLKTYIFTPVANFFKNAGSWIKNMWAAFKDTSVGKFLDKYIVSPLRTCFEWILKALRWVLKGAAAILSVINTKLAEEIRKGEAELGMTTSLAASGGDTSEDSKDYLKMPTFGGRTPQDQTKETPNNPLTETVPISSGYSGGNTTTINMQNGAITINVPAGTSLDERKLARMVREEISNLKRENNIRGGE